MTKNVMALSLLAGCTQEPLAQTWPQVADKHWFVCGCLAAWVALCIVWMVRGFVVRVEATKKP